MRVAILASSWTGYNDAACRELAALGVDLFVAFPDHAPDTAFDTYRVAEFAEVMTWSSAPAPGELRARVAAFAPEVLIVHSWHHKDYREALRAAPPGTLRILWMDNIWLGTLKQWLGRAVAPVYVQSLFDCVMVPGDRTEAFARMLGFAESEVIRGSLSADSDLFARPHVAGRDLVAAARFVACLRLVHHKGADVLAEAYREYRELTEHPWSLRVVGDGPMRSAYEGRPGVELMGFLQPAAVAREMHAASCLVHPSRLEPFGVALHEATLSALPVITTYGVGASAVFVQDSQNGWVVASDDARALARAMLRMSSQSPDELEQMSAVSSRLSARTSSAGWARNLHQQLGWRLSDLHAVEGPSS